MLPVPRIVQSFETVAITLAEQQNFTDFETESANIAVRIETVSRELNKEFKKHLFGYICFRLT